MIAKSSMPNASRLLFMILFAAALFNSIHASSEDKKFEINKNHTSAKAIVGEKKEFNATVEFDPKDYDGKKLFNLTIGGCKLFVEATKKPQNDVNFEFYNDKSLLGSSPNPKSFLVQEQSLTFYHSTGSSVLSCGKNFEFNPIEGQTNFTLEISLEGIPDNLVLKADNLIYEQSENEKESAMLWIWISVGVGSFLLIAIIVAIGVGICIYRKRKAAASKESNVQFKPEINVENIAIPKEVSQKQRSSKEKPSESKPSKTLKADQKPSVRPSSQEAKPIETQVEKPAAAQSQEAMPAKTQTQVKEKPATVESQPPSKSILETLPTFDQPAIVYRAPENLTVKERLEHVMLEPLPRERPLKSYEKEKIEEVKQAFTTINNLTDQEKLELVERRDNELKFWDRMYEDEKERQERLKQEEQKKMNSDKKQKK